MHTDTFTAGHLSKLIILLYIRNLLSMTDLLSAKEKNEHIPVDCVNSGWLGNLCASQEILRVFLADILGRAEVPSLPP